MSTNETKKHYSKGSWLTGFRLGLRDGELEATGKKASPGAMNLALAKLMHGDGYILGRQHALSRAGMSGGSRSDIGPLRATVNTLKELLPEGKLGMIGRAISSNEPEASELAPAAFARQTRVEQLKQYATRRGRELAQVYSCEVGCTPCKVEDNRVPAGTYNCIECNCASITWKQPVDKYKIRCPKCGADMVKEKPKEIPTPDTTIIPFQKQVNRQDSAKTPLNLK